MKKFSKVLALLLALSMVLAFAACGGDTTEETTAADVVIAASHGTLVHHEAVAKTCDTAGNVEHWTCPDCNKYYLDAAATQETTATDVVVAASHGTLAYHAAVSASCSNDGNIDEHFDRKTLPRLYCRRKREGLLRRIPLPWLMAGGCYCCGRFLVSP